MQKTVGRFNTPLQQLFLLEERVRLAGAQLPDEDDRDKRYHGIKCVINAIDCVIDLHAIAEVFDDRQVTRIPGSAPWIEGVMNYRGTLVPVYSPQLFLFPQSQGPVNSGREGPLVVLHKNRKANEFNAIRVGRITGMQKFSLDDFQTLEKNSCGPESFSFYTDDKVVHEGQSWLRLNINQLMNTMNSASPHQQ